MKITKKDVAEKILSYLKHDISIDDLVHWAENALMEGEFEEENFEIINDIVSRIGLADVKAFGLMWEDCEKYLNMLGYNVKVDIESAV